MATQDDVTELRKAFELHVQWDNAEHALLRKEHEVDNRVLVQAVNDLRVTVERGINKVIMFCCGTMITVAGAVVTEIVVTHLH